MTDNLSGLNVRDRVSVLQLLESAKECELNTDTISKYLVRHGGPAVTVMRRSGNWPAAFFPFKLDYLLFAKTVDPKCPTCQMK